MMLSKLEQHVVSKGAGVTAGEGVLCVVADSMPADALLYGDAVARLLLDKLVGSSRYTRPIVVAADRRAVDLQRNHGDSLAVVDAFTDDLSERGNGFANVDEIWARIREEAEKTQGIARPLVILSLSALAVKHGWKPSLRMLQTAQYTAPISPIICVCHKDMHAPTEFNRLKDMADVYVEATPNRGTSSSQEVLGSIHIIRRSRLSGKVTEDAEFFGRQNDKLVIVGAAASRTEPMANEQKAELTDTDSGAVTIEPVAKPMTKPAPAALITLDEDDPEFDEDEDPDADLDL